MRMHRWLILALLFAVTAHAAPRPNIVIILCDDMGWSDLGCMGGEIHTPNLDKLAAHGLRFTQFYNTGRCCPTRASLLTGLYPHQAGIGHMTEDRGHDGYRGDLNDRCVTIAQVLKPAGYATYAVGKWHVTKHVEPNGDKHNWPLQRGFDRFYGTITGAGSYYDPGTLTRDNTNVSPYADPGYQPKRYYYTDAITDNATRFVTEHDKTKPFFLYMAYTAAHWPMHALPEDIEKYKGKYDAGYESTRQARVLKARQLGLMSANADVAPTVGDWTNVKNKDWETRCMEVYAAMIDRMDQGVGRLVATLEKTGQLDNTLILFLQDNGGCQEAIGRQPKPPPSNSKTFPVLAKDAIRLEVIPRQTRDGRPMKQGEGVMPGPDGTYIAYGINWANVSNTPFREYKHFVHEGGIATPLIAHWPAGIHRDGQFEPQPGHLIDLMATCVDLAGANYPAAPVKPMEGRSLVPAFAGHSLNREALYWEHEGNRAIRKGPWKLVGKEDQPWELYNIDTDRAEQHDLAPQQPERTKALTSQWQTWAERANVLPIGTWKAPIVGKAAKKND